jgi:putative transposase
VRPNDASIREAMKKVASERRRFGYPLTVKCRIQVILDREGIVIKPEEIAACSGSALTPQ